MTYQIRIQDPSGKTRVTSLHPKKPLYRIGSSFDCDISLKDPLALGPIGEIYRKGHLNDNPTWFWFKKLTSQTTRLGGISVIETELPCNIPMLFGNSQITLEKATEASSNSTLHQPKGIPHWKTLSPEGVQLLQMVKRGANTPLPIYFEGETGSGKEVLARLTHAWSSRKSGPFVAINCGALPLSLAESELFGHRKGAFTGAHQDRTGALLQAHLGTLFLDEVADLSPDIQVKLLRFLENGEIRPVGSDRTIHTDVRVVCATHKNLKNLIRAKKFRQDLYYRLASLSIQIPPLRSRPQDIEFLARQFSGELKKSLAPQAIHRLLAHSWPGNVRELRHSIERAVGFSNPFQEILTEQDFEFLLQDGDSFEKDIALKYNTPVLNVREMEKILLMKALKHSHGNRTKAAKLLGVARSTLFEMVKRHQIPKIKEAPVALAA